VLTTIITVLASAAVVCILGSLMYAIIAVVFEWGSSAVFEDTLAERFNLRTQDDEIAAATAALVKPVTPTGETAEIAASLEAQRRHERSKSDVLGM
jgi:hypothetical protein